MCSIQLNLIKVPPPTTRHDMLRCDLAKIKKKFYVVVFVISNAVSHTDSSAATTSAGVFLQAEK